MNRFAMGIDVGGTHATAGILDLNEGNLIDNTLVRRDVNSSGSSANVIKSWINLNQRQGDRNWLFAVTSFPAIIVTRKLVPETKNRPLEEIEKFWLK